MADSDGTADAETVETVKTGDATTNAVETETDEEETAQEEQVQETSAREESSRGGFPRGRLSENHRSDNEEADSSKPENGEAIAIWSEEDGTGTDLEARTDDTPIATIMDSALGRGEDSGTVRVAGRSIQYTIEAAEDGREYICFDGDDLGMRGGSDVAIPADADKEEAALILRRRREHERMFENQLEHNPRREATQKAYEADWRLFREWCRKHGRGIPADMETVSAYVRDMIGTYKASTMQRKLTAINHVHAKNGHAKPARKADEPLRTTFHRFVREGEATVDQAEAAAPEIVRLFIEDANETYKSACKRLQHEKRRKAKRIAWRRNRAGFVTSLHGALRVSELLGLRRKDVELQPGAMILQLQEAKTAKAGELQRVVIFEDDDDGVCPVEEMKAWISLLEDSIDGELQEDGAVFRGLDQWGNVREGAMSRQGWWKVVKQTARGVGKDLRKLGYDPEDFSTHSFRAGFVTYSGQIGYDEHQAMRHTRHKSLKVFRQYRREGELMNRETNMTSKIHV
jgi:site-specific recombinase XerD